METLEDKVKQKPKRDLSLWQEIIYILKLMRSVFLYRYGYEEVLEIASWRRIGLLATISTVIAVVLHEIIRLSYIVYYVTVQMGASLWVIYPQGFPLANIIESSIRSICLETLVMLISSVAIGYCIQLWFSDENTHYTWLSFAFVVTMIGGFNSVIIGSFAQLNESVGAFTGLGTPFWSFLWIMLLLTVLSFIFVVYSYVTIFYSFIRSTGTTVSHFHLRFVLIIILLEGISFMLSTAVNYIYFYGSSLLF